MSMDGGRPQYAISKNPSYPVLCCLLPGRVSSLFVQVVSPPLDKKRQGIQVKRSSNTMRHTGCACSNHTMVSSIIDVLNEM